MAVNSGNGWIKFSIGTQVLKWNTGVANVFTSDPVDADGAPLTGEDLTAVTVVEGDTVGDGYDSTYWTFGEGPVECVLCTDNDAVIYAGTPHFKAEGQVITVHPTPEQIESGRVGNGLAFDEIVTIPATPVEITGAQGTDDTAILVAVLGALEMLGLITDSTTDGS